MKRMPLSRLFALPLALTLLLSPAAQALTPDQARELLQDYYIDEVPEDVLDQNTIQAMLEALGDPYTTYFSPEEYGAFTGSMSDTDTVGVGIYSLVTADGPLIQRVYENTPAADAGLQPGDLVTAVDGRSTAGQDAGTVAAWLKGDPGTRVELSYRRDGAEYTAVLTRRAITVPATYTELWDGHIGYIDCDTFGGETVAHFVSGMEDTAAGADHWIVDLRGNGGGEVDAAMGAAGCFTGSGVLAYLKDSTGAYGAYGSNDDARTLSPVIVLTDGETASASELFASDIRDTNTGILVGGRTFGKGVAQTVLDQRALPDYFPDGDAIKITSYRFYAPSGSTTDTVGLIPHLLVDPDLAPEVATLLSASSPKGSTEGYLRIDFNWRWYVELDTALSETHRDAFTALLEALPDGVRVLEGTGGPDGWADTTVEELVGRYVLTSYRDRSFTDTAGSPYAAQIDRLATYGILAGTGGGAFQPEGSLTRAQLCALLAQAINCRVPTGESQFTDVSMDDWYGLCVNAVARLGLVEGVGEGRFAPDAPVSHEQFITIMARLSKRLNMYMDLTLQEMPTDAAEAAGLLSYSGWARDSVWLLALSQKGLLGNTINLLWEPLEDIDPAAVTTREEAAAMLVRVYERYTSKLDWLHGFYAFSSYSQIDLTASMDAVSVGWARMEYDPAAGPVLNSSRTNGNDWVRPDDPTPATDYWDTRSLPYNLNVYASAGDSIPLPDGTTTSTVAAVTGTPEARAQAVAALTAASADYAGLTIDFEGLKGDTIKQNYVTFLKELDAALPQGKTLYVCVQPDTWYTGFDYRGIGEAADKVILMAHDYQWTSVPDSYAGTTNTDSPVTPFASVYEALRDLTDPATGVADRSKLALQISFGSAGFHVDGEDRLLETTIYHPAPSTLALRLAQPDTQVVYSEEFRNPCALYTTEDGSRYKVWYENEQSVLDKVALARMFGITGVSLWRISNIPADGAYDVWSALLTQR